MSPRRTEPVLVTGAGVLCSTATDLPGFAAALAAGRTGLVRSPDRADGPAFEAPLGPFDLAAGVDAVKDLPPDLRHRAVRTAHRSPLAVRAATVVAVQAWQRARLSERPLPPERIGLVVAGSNLTERYSEAVGGPDATYLPARYALQHQDTDHVGTLSRILRVTGEGYTVGGASASGNVAIVNAARLVALGVVDACLVVGALTELSTLQRRGFLAVGAMAASGPGAGEHPASPFDVAHRGFHPGQAAACLVLEHPGSARRRGVPALARLLGYALALDGNHLADPSVDGEARAMTAAITAAGLTPEDVDHVSAHGTGSPLGDRTEAAALLRVFGTGGRRPWVNATKGLTGHCLSSAGVVEAVAAIVQLGEGFRHPDPGLTDPVEPGLRLVGDRALRTGPRHVLSNSFGFGGLNSAVLFGRGQDRPGDAQL